MFTPYPARRRSHVFPPALLLAVACLPGCARYGFDLVQPPELARHVGSTGDTITPRPPLEYRLRAVENRLVISIANPTDDPILLVGEQSFVVDPDGQSHPLRGETIAPHSFIRRTFPPPRPAVYRSGPTFGLGFGVGYSRFHGRHFYGGEDFSFYDGPGSYALYDPGDPTHWDWPGVGEIRLSLTYRRGERTFHDDFAFRKKKETT